MEELLIISTIKLNSKANDKDKISSLYIYRIQDSQGAITLEKLGQFDDKR